MKDMGISSQITQAMKEVIDTMTRDKDAIIEPSHIAGILCGRYEGEAGCEPHLRHAAFLSLCQTARSLLRYEARRREPPSGQDDLFGEDLQDRYPCTRGGRELYVPRHRMAAPEFDENADRLEREGLAKVRHSEALRDEKARLSAAGHFSGLAA